MLPVFCFHQLATSFSLSNDDADIVSIRNFGLAAVGGGTDVFDSRTNKNAWLATARHAAFTEHLLNSSPAPIVVTDELGYVRLINRVAQQLLRRTNEEACNRDFAEILGLNEADRTHLYDSLRSASVETARTLLQAKLDEGLVCPLELRAGAIEDDGKPSVIVVLRDLTSEQEMKSALDAHVAQLLMTKEALQHHNAGLEKLVEEQTGEFARPRTKRKRANAAKSEFLANMSHELRTPLHCILSFARFGVRGRGSLDQTKALGYFQRIESSGSTLLELLNALLDLSKLEAEAVTLNREKLDLQSLIAEIAEDYAALRVTRGLKSACQLATRPCLSMAINRGSRRSSAICFPTR